MTLSEDIVAQIDALELDESRPLLILDADEVLVQFVTPLENFLNDRGLYLDLVSFRLSGNIKRKVDHRPIESDRIPDLIARFFAETVSTAYPIDGAPEAVRRFTERANTIVLSNVPIEHRDQRRKSIAEFGLDLPVVANRGLKGPAVQALVSGRDTPSIFVDDLPHNLQSVAEHADQVHRVHFLSHVRLAKVLGEVHHADAKFQDWQKAGDHIDRFLEDQGY